MVEDGDQQKKDVAESQQISSESEAKKAVYPSTKGKELHKEKLLERLRIYFEENDVEFEDGWRVEVKQRTAGNSAGTCDAYYFSPSGKRYRSRAEIARDHGIAVETISRAGVKRPVVLLSRPEALANAKKRAAVSQLPLKLPNGVTVTNFGTPHAEYTSSDDLVMMGYTAEFVDDEGVQFISTIVDAGTGPFCKVIAALASAEGRKGYGPAEVGSGVTPDAAWQAVVDRQPEVLEIVAVQKQNRTAKNGSSGQSIGMEQDYEGMDPGDRLLVYSASLSGTWGLDRYGLADITCLQALEGQPGVEDTKYHFLEERSNWDEESRRLMREATKHGKGLRVTSSGRSRVRAPLRSKEDRVAADVHRVIESMIRQLEAGELRAAAAEHRALLKVDRDRARMLEKEQRRIAKEREREVARQLQEKQREMARQAALEAARTEEDEMLPSANIPPPMPRPIGAGKVPPSCEPTILEAWHLIHRFRELLNIEAADVPSLSQLEAALIAGPGVGHLEALPQLDACSRASVAILDFLTADLYRSTVALVTEANADVREVDLRPNMRASYHPIPLTCDTWQDVARRYLTIVATAAMVRGKEDLSGLLYPTSILAPDLVLQLLTAGPPVDIGTGPAMLPTDSAPSAWIGMVARMDAESLAASIPPLNSATDAEIQEYILQQRCILMELANIKGENGKKGELLCFQGQQAAAAAKFGRPLDLRAVGARVDVGLYARCADPMAAFASDINYVCALHQAAVNKQASVFAEENSEEGIEEVAAMAVSKLEEALTTVEAIGSVAYISKKKTVFEQETDKGDVEGGDPIVVGNGTNVFDLSRPFCPWEGCAVCWSEDDPERVMTCSDCSWPCHTYCLEIPLDEAPLGGWKCAKCSGMLMESGIAPQKVTFAPGSNGDSIWRVAQLLGSKSYTLWTFEERAQFLSILCYLLSESPALRESLLDEDAELRDMRRELFAKRGELRQRQQEETAAVDHLVQDPKADNNEKQAVGNKKNGAGEKSARPTAGRATELAEEIEQLVKRISELEHLCDQIPPPRLEKLGVDRHWNRYYVLPAAALGARDRGERPAAVVVERHRVDSMEQGHGSCTQKIGEHDWQVGIYRDAGSVETLLAWLNTRGVRERGLHMELRRVFAEMQSVHRDLASPGGVSGVPAPMDVDDAAIEVADAANMERLRAAILDFESGLTANSRHEVRGGAAEMELWKKHAAAATRPQEFMAVIVALEAALAPGLLKMHWRPWAMPAPAPRGAHTMAAVWLRLEALKGATKMKVKLNIAPRDVLGGRYPKRPKVDEVDAGKRGGKRTIDAVESDGSARVDFRRQRAVKRARDAGSECVSDDEALARQLDAELNRGGRPKRPSRMRQNVTANKSYAEESEDFEEGEEEEEEEEAAAAGDANNGTDLNDATR